jgi:beta-glucosidase
MPGPTKFRTEEAMNDAVANGEIDIAQLNKSLQRVVDTLQQTGRIGLTDPVDARGALPERSSQLENITSALLRRAAADGMVLLKNKNSTLPLSAKASEKITIFGRPAAEPSIFGGGSASLMPAHISTPLAALRESFPALGYSEGVSVERLVSLASLQKTPGSEVKLEWFNSDTPDEKALFRTEVLPKSEYMMMEDIHSGLHDIRNFCTRMTMVIKPTVTGPYRLSCTGPGSESCYLDGSLVATMIRGPEAVTEDYIFNRARLERCIELPIILNASKQYTLTIVSQSSKHSPVHINREFYVQGTRVGLAPVPDDEKAIAQAVSIAAGSTTPNIIFVGTSTQWESEGFDRMSYSLPLRQNDLVQSIAKAATGPTIVVINSGSPVDCSPWIDSVDAVLQAWFPGQEFGSAVADVLTGRVSPSARLPTTIPRSIEATGPGDLTGKTEAAKGVQKQIVYQEGLSVGYRAFNQQKWYDPLFAFGHGLSYSRFTYSGFKKETLSGSEDISATISVTVKNEGSVEAAEVVQLYVQPPMTSVERPAVELAAFGKTSRISPGSDETVQLEVMKQALSFWDVEKGAWKVEGGEYHVLFAASGGVGDWIQAGDNIIIKVEDSFHWSG